MGGKVAQASYLDKVTVVVTDNLQYPVVELTEVSSNPSPGPCDELVLEHWFLSLARAMCHTDVTLGDVFFDLRGHTWPVQGVSCLAYASFNANV